MRALLIPLVVLAVLLPAVAAAQTQPPPAPSAADAEAAPAPPPTRDRWFFGGGLGLGFGDVNWVELSPVAGYRATRRLDVGLSLIFRYRKDKRFEPQLSTTDYGAGLFARYLVYKPIFVHAEYEYLSFEYFDSFSSTDRGNNSAVLIGPGIAQPIGGKAVFLVTALYDVLYDSGEISPYSSPWRFRIGVAVGF